MKDLLFYDKPKFRYADVHQNLPAGKVVDTNDESRGRKPSRHVEMFATKSTTKSRTQIMSRTCPRLCRKVGMMEFGL